MPSIQFDAESIKTALMSNLMFKGFPFADTEKPGLTSGEERDFGTLDDKLLLIKQDLIAKREQLVEDEREACTVEAVFSGQELRMLLMVFEAIAKEFPPDNDMDLRMHVPSREAFDSLHGRLKQLSQG